MNCPNCAAPITGPVCEYCGTVHEHAVIYEEVPLKVVQVQMELNRQLIDAVKYSSLGIMTSNEIRKEFGLREL